MSDQPMHAEIEWTGGLQFTARAGNHDLIFDGERHGGSSPMEMLMISMAGCMAIDLVHILGRMRSGLKSVRARIEGVRADAHPRRFTAIVVHFEIAGAEASQIERAIALSRDTFCSVYASLRPDIDVKITYELAK